VLILFRIVVQQVCIWD